RERLRSAASTRLLERHRGQEIRKGLPLTAALLRRGLPLLLDAALEDEEVSVRFDALSRVEGASQLGGFHYAPVLFHEAERPSSELRLLLAAYGLLLGRVQGKEPGVGMLIHGRECQARRGRLVAVTGAARRIPR